MTRKIAHKYLQSLEKYCRHIPGSFKIEDIHDLRVDYKRLRAFTRLCGEEAKARHLKIPTQLRDVYKAAGKVRDLQLFLAKITLFAKVKYALPQFTECLQKQLFAAKEEMVKKIEKVEWAKVRKEIKDEMPPVLQDASIRQFVNRKIASIHILMLAADREEDLHEVRKNLKDLRHVDKIFVNDVGIAFPFPAWQDAVAIDQLGEKLGDFNDECITLYFLQSNCSDNISAAETKHITTWRNMQMLHVEEDKQRLLAEIRQLNLTPPDSPVK